MQGSWHEPVPACRCQAVEPLQRPDLTKSIGYHDLGDPVVEIGEVLTSGIGAGDEGYVAGDEVAPRIEVLPRGDEGGPLPGEQIVGAGGDNRLLTFGTASFLAEDGGHEALVDGRVRGEGLNERLVGGMLLVRLQQRREPDAVPDPECLVGLGLGRGRLGDLDRAVHQREVQVAGPSLQSTGDLVAFLGVPG